MKFYTDEELKQIHEDFLEEDNVMASNSLMNASDEFRRGLNNYIDELVEDGFKRGFRCAMKLLGENNG